jgi:predicted anti-sigma-YlaC factor YlaD
MKCRDARRLFGAYWDDELTQGEREWLESHFTGCSGCRESYDTLARSLELASGLPRVEPAADFAERVLARTRRTAAAPDRLPVAAPRWIPAAAAAAVLLIAGVVFVQMRVVSTHGPVTEPVAVNSAPATSADVTPATTSANAVLEPQLVAAEAFPDSLFDHSADVEFVLDPVTVRRGQAHPATKLAPPITRGEQATITF